MKNEIKKLLINSGWSEKRQINIKPIEKIYNNCGYDLFESAKCFLKNFGELILDFSNNDNYERSIRILSSVSAYEKKYIECYENFLSKTMLPIASSWSLNCYLFIANDGMFYAINDDIVDEYTNKFPETLYNLLYTFNNYKRFTIEDF